jgi:hypothetical protein
LFYLIQIKVIFYNLPNNLTKSSQEILMKCNVGGADRVIRIFTGILIIGTGVYFQSSWGAIGAVPLVTAGLRWCPLYLPLGISTVKESTAGSDS